MTAELLDAVAADQMARQLPNELLPTCPVSRRRYDRAVVEDRRGWVGSEVMRHERQLHDGPQAQRPQSVIHGIDAGEVVHRSAVDLAVDAEVVEEHAMRAHSRHAQLSAGHVQRLLKLGAHWPTVLSDTLAEGREMLRADHRAPQALESRARAPRSDHDGDRSGAGGRTPGHRTGEGIRGRLDRRQAGDGIPSDLVGRDGRVGIGSARHGEHVTATMIEWQVRTVGGRCTMDEIADGARHGIPAQRHVARAALGTDGVRRGQRLELAHGLGGPPPADTFEPVRPRVEGLLVDRSCALRRADLAGARRHLHRGVHDARWLFDQRIVGMAAHAPGSISLRQ